MAKNKPTRRTAKDWEKIVEDQKTSGLPPAQYCKKNKITLSSFYAWNSKLANGFKLDEKPAKKPAKKAVKKKEVDLPKINENPEGPWTIELELPGGIQLRMKYS